VKNIGSEEIGPEGFVFELKNLTTGQTATRLSGTDGLAVFGLSFTEEDIGKTYTYLLTETAGDMEHVTYSTAKYNITVAITLNEKNELVATVSTEGQNVESFVGAFENVYDYTPELPETGDNSQLLFWFMLMLISGGAAITLTFCGNKKHYEPKYCKK